MKYRIGAAALALTVSLPWPALAEVIQATLYKMPQCGCCEGHAADRKSTRLNSSH